jgi:hypothetical protein
MLNLTSYNLDGEIYDNSFIDFSDWSSNFRQLRDITDSDLETLTFQIDSQTSFKKPLLYSIFIFRLRSKLNGLDGS